MANILLVDDSASMREMVTFTLSKAGHNVSEAEDGVDGLAIAKQKQFSLVLTDINMPNMDGIALITELRKLPEYRFLPILVLSTEKGADKKNNGKIAGATGWIEKPFNPDNLLATLNRVL